MVSVHHGMWADCMLTRLAPVLVMRRAYACMFIDGHVHITVTMWSSISRPYPQSGPLAGKNAKNVGHPKRARHAASALQMSSRCSSDQLALACVPSTTNSCARKIHAWDFQNEISQPSEGVGRAEFGG